MGRKIEEKLNRLYIDLFLAIEADVAIKTGPDGKKE